MGVSGGPNINKDGLVLVFDAANHKSYPDTGTAWNDLSGNNYHGISSTNTTYVEYDNTEIAWNFKGGEVGGHGIFIQDLNYVTGASDQISNMTISCMLKTRSGTSGNTDDQRIILSFDRSAVFRFALGGDTGTPSSNPGKPSLMFMHGSGGSQADVNFTNSRDLRDDQWHHVVLTFEANVSNGLKLYIDGELEDTISSTYGDIGEHSEGETPRYGVIGAGSEKTDDSVGGATNPDSIFDGHIARLFYYYKTFTADEVTQDFNAIKSRFGL